MKISHKWVGLGILLGLESMSARAQVKTCGELQREIETKLEAAQVTHYVLKVVDPNDASDAKVVGSCDGGSKRIIYSRGAAAAHPSATPKPVG